MVEIIDKTPEEIARDERVSKLVELTKHISPLNMGVVSSDGQIEVFSLDSKRILLVRPNERNIEIYFPAYFEYAFQLAKTFQSEGEGEFTLKRNYKVPESQLS
ncbi:MAG: hypothetical protein AABX85_02450 [Nanoarchaeota archaeon]